MSLYRSLLDGFINRQVMDILQMGITENTSCKCEIQMKSGEQFQISMVLSVAPVFLCHLSFHDLFTVFAVIHTGFFFLALIIAKLKISFYRKADHKAVGLSSIRCSAAGASQSLSPLSSKQHLGFPWPQIPLFVTVAEITK